MHVPEGSSGSPRVRPGPGRGGGPRDLLLAIGEDPDRDGLLDTPARVARAYAEMFAGLRQRPGGRPGDHLRPRPRRDGPGQGHRGVLHAASTTSCRSTGVAHVGYIPGARRADHRAVASWRGSSTSSPSAPRCRSGSPPRSPTPSSSILEPRGVIVVIECEHLCMSMRGVRKPGAQDGHSRGARCSCATPATRAEAMSLIARLVRLLSASGLAARRRLPSRLAALGAASVMGVVNVTPDSFSDGGLFLDADAPSAHGLAAGEPRRRPRRRGRRVDAARRRARRPEEEIAARRPRGRGASPRGRPRSASTPCARDRRGRGRRPAPPSSTTSPAASPIPRWPASSPRRRAVRRDALARATATAWTTLAVYDDVVADVCAELSTRVRRRRGRGPRARGGSSSTPASASPRTPTTTGLCCSTSTSRRRSATLLLVGRQPQEVPRPLLAADAGEPRPLADRDRRHRRRHRDRRGSPAPGACACTTCAAAATPSRWRPHGRVGEGDGRRSRSTTSTASPSRASPPRHHGVLDFEKREGQTFVVDVAARRRRARCARPPPTTSPAPSTTPRSPPTSSR